MKKIYSVALIQDSRYDGLLNTAIDILRGVPPGLYVINTDLYLKSSTENVVSLFFGITNELAPSDSSESKNGESNIEDVLKIIAVTSKPELIN